jgi:hypothetical protein
VILQRALLLLQKAEGERLGEKKRNWKRELRTEKKESHCRFIEMNFFSFRLFALDFCVLS